MRGAALDARRGRRIAPQSASANSKKPPTLTRSDLGLSALNVTTTVDPSQQLVRSTCSGLSSSSTASDRWTQSAWRSVSNWKRSVTTYLS